MAIWLAYDSLTQRGIVLLRTAGSLARVDWSSRTRAVSSGVASLSTGACELLDLTWQFFIQASPQVRAELAVFLTQHGWRPRTGPSAYLDGLQLTAYGGIGSVTGRNSADLHRYWCNRSNRIWQGNV